MSTKPDRKAFYWPPEHGVWGILLGSFFVAPAMTHGWRWQLWSLLLAFVSFHLGQYQLSVYLKRRKQLLLGSFVGALLLAETSLALATSANGELFAAVSIWFGVLLCLAIWMYRRRLHRSFVAQIGVVGGYTAITPVALILLGERSLPAIFTVWGFVLLFFISGILLVRSAIQKITGKAGNRPPFGQQKAAIVCCHFLLLILLWLGGFWFEKTAAFLIAFIPTFIQAWAFLYDRIMVGTIKQLGWLQIVQTFLFVLLLLVFSS